MRTAITITAFACAALLAACSSGNDVSAAPPPSITSTPAGPTTEATPSPTTAPSLSPSPTATTSPTELTLEPDPAIRGDDPVAAIQAIENFRNELLTSPSPDLVEEIYAEECTCLENFRSVLIQLVDQDLRFEFGGRSDLTNIDVMQNDGILAIVRYELPNPSTRLLDENGETQETTAPSESVRLETVVLRAVDQVWRVQSSKVLSDG